MSFFHTTKMSDLAEEPDAMAKQMLVILVGSPLTENIYRRIGAKELSAHFEVIVIDCLKWIRDFSDSLEFAKKELPSIIEADSEAELNMILRRRRPVVVVDFLGRGSYTRSVQDACRAVGAIYVTHNLLPYPMTVSSNAPLRSLLRHPWRTTVKLVRHLWRWARFRNPYPPDVALIAGSKSETHWLISAGMVIRTATEGYFELNKLRKTKERGTLELPALKDKQYLLFIDDCLALSFDFLLGDFSPIDTPEHYHSVLNSYFDKLEKITGLPVVIAAHPVGIDYPNYDLLFGGRRVFHNSTALLSLGCSCALTHFSSAINYPVLLRKPIAILTFDKLRVVPQGEIAALIAMILQRPLLDMSSQTSSSHALLAKIMDAPVESAYSNYTLAYIVDTDEPGDHPFDNLVKYLKATCGKAI